MSAKIKVLHVVGKMHPGGIETLLMNIYRHTDRDTFEYHFAVQTEEKAFYDDEILELGGTIFRQPHPQRSLSRFRREFAANVTRHGPYAAVHSHIFGFSGYVLKLADRMDIPVRVSHSHNTHDSRQSSVLRKVYRSYMRQLISNHATTMLGCSRAACESLFGDHCWSDRRVDVIPNAIMLEPYEQLSEDRSELRRRLGVHDCSAPLFAHIGRFSQQKNHAFLLEAFACLAAQRPDAKLFLIGDGPLRQDMERKAKQLAIDGQVQFLGLRKDVPELLGAMDGFLLPSLYEGLGIVLIEAQAAGIPCLVSNRIPEEADLGLGMIHRLRLEDSAQRWGEEMNRIVLQKRHPWNDIQQALQKSGYDIKSSVSRLERIYRGESIL
ncbi:glycosyltransferase family 1 protein [Paenibacillus abyssi]|uniref:Glycosyltransferase EpsF n=1 Tax=Paenibacillus abyssi TaxID=1340531 RepID=A0A917CV16_9BACL|nr:glycosyltransferase family 1 protein [Paenibacillus abyssi]GGF98562.1 putative glycosyltransferase EpsF [Paenibacillus abyssi]